MMKRTLPYMMAAGVLMMAFIMPVHAAVEIGKSAPAIEATDTNGNAFKLEDYKGKIVWDKTKPDGMMRKCLDVSKMKQYGFKPSITL